MKEEIINVIRDTLDIKDDNINEKSSLVYDLEIDSLDLIDLIAVFEKKYNIQIPDKDIKLFQTVGDLIEYIEEKKL